MIMFSMINVITMKMNTIMMVDFDDFMMIFTIGTIMIMMTMRPTKAMKLLVFVTFFVNPFIFVAVKRYHRN